jgi:hypothetical protein
MTFFRRAGLLGGALLACALTAVACSSGDDADPKQCTVTAAFDLTVRAVSGALPADTKLEVKYGGGNETYQLGTPGEPDVVLCHEDAPDGGDAGAEVSALHCKLWTQAAATVTVSATGYPTVKQDLEAKAIDECIQTVPVEIVLGNQDAGI